LDEFVDPDVAVGVHIGSVTRHQGLGAKGDVHGSYHVANRDRTEAVTITWTRRIAARTLAVAFARRFGSASVVPCIRATEAVKVADAKLAARVVTACMAWV
jgi:hypothetical protein